MPLLVPAACRPAESTIEPRPPGVRPQSSAEHGPIADGDDTRPKYWTDQLGDAPTRGRALSRLRVLFGIQRAGGEKTAKDAQHLIDTAVAPLVELYVEHYDELDAETRVGVISLLVEFRDVRAEPAFKKAFETFVQRAQSSRADLDLKWAARANAELRLPSLALPMLRAFEVFRASTELGGMSYRDLMAAMNAQPPNPAWVTPMLAKLDVEMTIPTSKDRAGFDDYRNQLFWQVTAMEVLANVGDPRAIDSLLKVLLTPTKADLHATALLALMRFGKPAADAATELLEGRAEKLQAFHLERLTGTKGAPNLRGHVQVAALVLGSIGRGQSSPAMVAALAREKDPSTRAVIARELVKLPPTDETKNAFKRAYAAQSIDDTIARDANAVEVLSEAAGQFFDPEVVDWLLARAATLKGDSDKVTVARRAALATALKLAKTEHLHKVKDAIRRYGTATELELYARTEALLTSCQKDADCYLKVLTARESQAEDLVAGIKAGYMLALLAGESTADPLLKSLDAIHSPALRYVVALILDHLHPRGSKAVASKLRDIIDANAKTPGRDRGFDSPLKQVGYRLEARD